MAIADSELVLVETSRTRAAPAQAEESEAPHRGRTRPPRVEVADEPLHMVETHKERAPPGS